jgi:hypothetical protein
MASANALTAMTPAGRNLRTEDFIKGFPIGYAAVDATPRLHGKAFANDSHGHEQGTWPKGPHYFSVAGPTTYSGCRAYLAMTA